MMNDEQVRLARHALGLPNERNRSYRNRFVFGEGSGDDRGPFEEWSDLVAKGLAERHENSRADGSASSDCVRFTFELTRAGAEAVLLKRESLCPEDFPPRVVTGRAATA